MKKNVFELFSEYVQALLGAVLLAILIRGFVFEPFKIPSESMYPTLLVGDHIFVKRYEYGLRVPFTKFWLTEFKEPKRGDVVVFSYPEDEDINFIKRIVGVPGDVVRMEKGELLVNGKNVQHKDITISRVNEDNRCWIDLGEKSQKIVPEQMQPFPYYRRFRQYQPMVETNADGKNYVIQRSLVAPLDGDFEITVPERNFFVMGDNRDQSQDSRFWGFVPRENLKGKALFIWLSLNYEGVACKNEFGLKMRWGRFGRKII